MKDVVYTKWDTEATDASERLQSHPLKGRIHLTLLPAHGHQYNFIILILSSMSQPDCTGLVMHVLSCMGMLLRDSSPHAQIACFQLLVPALAHVASLPLRVPRPGPLSYI